MKQTESDQCTRENFAYLFSKSVFKLFLVVISLLFCMGMLSFFTVSVSAKEQETVKVGYYFSHNLQAGNTNTFMGNGLICLNS